MYNATQALIEWLDGLGYDTYATIPSTRPERFITVQRTGGGISNTIDHPTYAVQCWAQTYEQAENDALSIRNEIIDGNTRPANFDAITINTSPYIWEDTATKIPRYQFVIDCVTHIK